MTNARRRRTAHAVCAALVLAALPAAAAPPAVASARAAVHRGVVVGDAIQWRTTIAFPPMDDASPVRVRLAVPLPPGETLDGPPGARAVRDGERIVAVDIDAPEGGQVVLRFTQPGAKRAPRAHLGAPLVEGDAVQIIDVDGDGGARFEPDPALGLDRTLGELVQPGVPHDERAAAIDALDFHPPIGAVPLVLRADPAVVARGGVDGALTTFAERRRGAAAGIGVAFVLAIAGLWALQRRLGKAAREEEAERVLAAEFQALARDGDP